MSDDHPTESYREGHPILWGLLSLVAVTAIVGGILGGGALFASRAVGLADDPDATQTVTQEETLVVPQPSETDDEPSDYLSISAIPEPELPSSTFSDTPEASEEFTLSSAQSEVGPMEAIDLSGSYPDGDGAILRVQQFVSGDWDDFPVTAPVNGGEFYTFIQASMLGENRFRMMDTDTGATSNEIRVTIQ